MHTNKLSFKAKTWRKKKKEKWGLFFCGRSENELGHHISQLTDGVRCSEAAPALNQSFCPLASLIFVNFASVGSVMVESFNCSQGSAMTQRKILFFIKKINAPMPICIEQRKKEQASDCEKIKIELQRKAHRFMYLAVLEHLLQAFQHLHELARLDSAVGQQHPPKLPLSDSAIHRIIPFKLEGEEEGRKIECTAEGQTNFKLEKRPWCHYIFMPFIKYHRPLETG